MLTGMLGSPLVARAAQAAPRGAASDGRLNLIWIVIDSLNKYWVNAYDAPEFIWTPNLDRLAAIVPPLPPIGPSVAPAAAIDEAAQLLRNGKRSALLLRGRALRGAGLEAAGRIAAKTGARLLSDTFAPHAEAGAGRIPVERLPYFAEQIVDTLSKVEQLILVGSKPPVSFFAYPGKRSWCSPEGCQFSQLAHEHEDGVQALEALDVALGGPVPQPARVPLLLSDLPKGPLNALAVAQAITHLTPEHAILADESATSGLQLAMMMARARPHDQLAITGGSIGLGLPMALGAAIACPDRKVVCTHGDGGAAYTMQALWSMAREKQDVTVVIYANRSYAILNIELQRVGALGSGPKALSMLDLHNPEMNWTKIAEGLGVEASRATTAEEFNAQYASAIKQRGPRLIEAMI